jgi:hypothetical protein
MAKIEVGLACGRNYLSVNGFVTAVEGDLCRDAELPGTHWNRELLESVAKGKTKKTTRRDPFASLPAIDAEAEYRAAKLKDRQEHDDFVARHLKGTFAVVEATHNESHNLWAQWSVENTFRARDPHDQRRLLHWEQISRGFMETIGAFRFGKDDVMPVTLSCFWSRLRVRPTDAGQLVLFWEMCSQVTDSRMAERFFKENTPESVINTDASNFHNVAHALKE